MRAEYKKLYHDLLVDIILEQQQDKLQMAGRCFTIACKYWQLLKDTIELNFFDKENEEIDFFKNVKPKFTGQIQYYKMLGEILMFVPGDEEKQIDFWKLEEMKFPIFCNKNKMFLKDYKVRVHKLDPSIFRRVVGEMVPGKQPFYDSDRRFCSPYDHFARGYYAYSMYHEFVSGSLKLITCFREPLRVSSVSGKLKMINCLREPIRVSSTG